MSQPIPTPAAAIREATARQAKVRAAMAEQTRAATAAATAPTSEGGEPDTGTPTPISIGQ